MKNLHIAARERERERERDQREVASTRKEARQKKLIVGI